MPGGGPKENGPSVNCSPWLFVDRFISVFEIEIGSKNIWGEKFMIGWKSTFLIVC